LCLDIALLKTYSVLGTLYSMYMNNVIFIQFHNKKNFPPGQWLKEPDICQWYHYNLPCLAIRDMSLGVWKAFVGLEQGHLFYRRPLGGILKMDGAMDVFFSVYGGISFAGSLPYKYREFDKGYWWIGSETAHGGDLMPLLTLDDSNPDMGKQLCGQP